MGQIRHLRVSSFFWSELVFVKIRRFWGGVIMIGYNTDAEKFGSPFPVMT